MAFIIAMAAMLRLANNQRQPSLTDMVASPKLPASSTAGATKLTLAGANRLTLAGVNKLMLAGANRLMLAGANRLMLAGVNKLMLDMALRLATNTAGAIKLTLAGVNKLMLAGVANNQVTAPEVVTVLLKQVTVPEATAPVKKVTVPVIEVTAAAKEVTLLAEEATHYALNPLARPSNTAADPLSLIALRDLLSLDLTVQDLSAPVDLALVNHDSDQAPEVPPEVQAPEDSAAQQDLDPPSVATKAHLAMRQPQASVLSQSQTWKQSTAQSTAATNDPYSLPIILLLATMATASSAKPSRFTTNDNRLLSSNQRSSTCRPAILARNLRLMTSHPRHSSAWAWDPRSEMTS